MLLPKRSFNGEQLRRSDMPWSCKIDKFAFTGTKFENEHFDMKT